MSDTHEIAKLVQALSEARAELKIYQDNDKEKETEDELRNMYLLISF